MKIRWTSKNTTDQPNCYRTEAPIAFLAPAHNFIDVNDLLQLPCLQKQILQQFGYDHLILLPRHLAAGFPIKSNATDLLPPEQRA